MRRHQAFGSRYLEQIMRDVRADFGAELAEFNGEAEHVHLLLNFARRGHLPAWSTASRRILPPFAARVP
jgi:REP element-mobilizing transposase RayT